MPVCKIFFRFCLCLVLLFPAATGLAQNNYPNFLRLLKKQQWKSIEQMNGFGLFALADTTTHLYAAWLQVIDVRKTAIRQLVVPSANEGFGEGKYIEDYAVSSPYLKRLSPDSAAGMAERMTNGRFFSLMNGAFFEQYQDSTQLSFPVKTAGKILTGGSGNYGPVAKPAHDYFKNIDLLTLAIGRRNINIVPYNTVNGYPLNDGTITEALVSYRYSDHPAKVLANNKPNRYHLLATINADQYPGDEILLVLTVRENTLEAAAQLLKSLGVQKEIMTIDGGSSVFIATQKQGRLQNPEPIDPQHPQQPIWLPHYLLFYPKN
jgi:hypothetical protein